MRSTPRYLAFVGLWIWVGLVPAARGDVVHLKSGVTKEGTVVSSDDNEVVLEIARRGLRARIRIPQAEIDHVEKTRPPKEEYQERLKQVEANDAESWNELGLWCEKKGLLDEARECFRKALKVNPHLKAAGEKLGLVSFTGGWVKIDEILPKTRALISAGKVQEAVAILESLRGSYAKLDSVKRRDVITLLCRCYELTGQWDKAKECYEDLVKSHGSLTPEVAVIRVKQKLLKEHPDGMIEAPAPALAPPAPPGKPDLVKAIGEGVKVVGEGVKAVAEIVVPHKPGPKVSLSDPAVMDAAIRAEAEKILKEADELTKKADGRALSEKLLRAANPVEHLQNLLQVLPNLLRLGTPQPKKFTIGPADAMYAKANERALDADFLVRDISKPLRLSIVKKRAAILDEFIVQARKQVEDHPLYLPPPPPNAPPDPSARARLLQMNVSGDRVERFSASLAALEKLYALKASILQPMSDDLVAENRQLERDMEPLADTKKKIQLLSEFAADLKECQKLEAKMQESWAKAQANHPGRFQYVYDGYKSPDGLYHFRDKGRVWRLHSNACVAHCDDAMDYANKRKALLTKYRERPQTQGELDSIKHFVVSVYDYKVNVSSQYNKVGVVE